MKCLYSLAEDKSVVALTVEDDAPVPDGWANSPADFGIETCPGAEPDPVIAATRARLAAAPADTTITTLIAAPDHAAMSRAGLLELAHARGMEAPEKLSKAELIERLSGDSA